MTPGHLFQFLASRGFKQGGQLRIAQIARRKFQPLVRWFSKIKVTQQRTTQRCGLAPWGRDLLLAIETQQIENLLHEVGAVRWHHAQAISHLMLEPGIPQRNLKVPRLLFRVLAASAKIGQQRG